MNAEVAQSAHDLIEVLGQMEERAAKVVKIEDLVALVSHDFRNPISAVMNHLYLLGQSEYGALNDKQQSVVRQLYSEMEMLSNLTRVVSDLAQGERAKRRLNPIEISVPALVETLEAEMQVVCVTAKIGFRRAIQWGATEVWSEPVRLQIALRNLLLYAVRSVAHSSVVLEVTANDSAVEFTIRADGASGDPAELSQPADNGIGLNLSERLVELIGGSLSVFQEPNLNTSFQVTIPDRADEEDR